MTWPGGQELLSPFSTLHFPLSLSAQVPTSCFHPVQTNPDLSKHNNVMATHLTAEVVYISVELFTVYMIIIPDVCKAERKDDSKRVDT